MLQQGNAAEACVVPERRARRPASSVVAVRLSARVPAVALIGQRRGRRGARNIQRIPGRQVAGGEAQQPKHGRRTSTKQCPRLSGRVGQPSWGLSDGTEDPRAACDGAQVTARVRAHSIRLPAVPTRPSNHGKKGTGVAAARRLPNRRRTAGADAHRVASSHSTAAASPPPAAGA